MTEMNTLSVIDGSGDTKHTWDPSKPDEVAAVKATYDALRKKGYMAFAVTDAGGRGTAITEFEPQLREIIMAPPIAGG
jgi:hypothetical protein